MAKKKKERKHYKLTPEFAAKILSRKKIRPDEPGTQPGDPGNGHVLVIDSEHQMFNGNIYIRRVASKTGTVRYNYNANTMTYQLHIDVWKFHNGEPPKGFVIHHDCLLPDGNFHSDENNIEYLFLMTRPEHTSYHKTLSPQIQRICQNPKCRKVFTATNGNAMYCCEECGLEVNAVRRLKFNRFVTPEVAKILEEAIEISSDFFIEGEHSKFGGRLEIRFYYYCHRPFLTDANKPAIMCARPDCKGRNLIKSISHAQNMVLERIKKHKNPLRTFYHEQFGKLDTIIIDDVPWFIGKQVATMLGYKDTDKAIRDHVEDADKKLLNYEELVQLGIDKLVDPAISAGSTQGGRHNATRRAIIINEFGVNDLIVDSELPAARKIKHWITHDVMPAILRTGQYSFLDHPSPMTDYFTDEELMMLLLFREQMGGDIKTLAEFNTLSESQRQLVAQLITELREKSAPPSTTNVEQKQD